MNTQSKALRLADLLDDDVVQQYSLKDIFEAAAELRRLHEVNQMLVESLEDISLFGEEDSRQTARTALAKAKENNNGNS